MEEKMQIICPSCRAKLSFLRIPNWQDKLVECPHCHFKEKANVYQSGKAAQGGQGEDDAPTQVSNGLRPAQNTETGVIKLKSSGRCFQLKMGTNILGRVAQSGTADLKISTDPYMSRRHLQVDVIQTTLGLEHRLVEIDSKNIIVLNGRPIQRGDIIKLKYGDQMILGQTEVIFDRPKVDDSEDTQLI